MSAKYRAILGIAIIAALVVLAYRKEAPDETLRSPQEIESALQESVIRYASDDFIGACFVRPGGLIEHEFFGLLPIHSFIPEPLSLSRLEEFQVEELAVFCGPSIDPKSYEKLEWGAAARTAQPIELEHVLKRWHQSIVPQKVIPDFEPVAIQIGGYNCVRVPSGTLLSTPRCYADLRFTDREGEPNPYGINVGKIFEYRGYIEGETKSEAVFTLDHLDENDLLNSRLQLELRLDVFLTYHPEEEFTTAQIELRNPDTGLRSEPISFDAKSYFDHHLNIPRKVSAVDGESKREADLFEDFVSDGRLEVILKGSREGVYLGVGNYDLNLRSREFEYVFVSDREIVVATSPQTLEKMLNTATTPGALSRRLAQSNGDIVLTAEARDDADRRVLQQLKRSFWNSPEMELIAGSLTELNATVRAGTPATARITADFRNAGDAVDFKRHLDESIRSAKDSAVSSIQTLLNRHETIGSMLTFALGGISMNFPEHNSPPMTERVAELVLLIEDSLENIHIGSDDNQISIEFTQPDSLSLDPETAQIALANLEEALGRDLFEYEEFELGDEMYRRATDRFPHVPQIWFRRAHELSFNMSREFDGYENRYAWIRRGINVLLDGAEQNPDRADLLWMAATIIGRKIGWSDDSAANRSLFSRDDRLHQRLAELINLEKTRSPDQQVDNWLVAKLLFEHCIEHHENPDSFSTIPPLEYYSQPAASQGRYARALSDSGHTEDSVAAWKEAEKLFREFGDRTIELADSERIRLNDYDSQLKLLGADDPAVKQLWKARTRIQYEEWLMLCKFEQTEAAQSVRKLAFEAAELNRQSKPSEALDLYRKSLRKLLDASKTYPDELLVLSGEFQQLARNYRNVAKILGESDSAELTAFLYLIEQSRSFSDSYHLPPPPTENEGEQNSNLE